MMMSCGPSDFDPQTLINTVRILASGADKPYAAPGDTVNLSLLAYDGRPVKAAPMKQYWLPLTCLNPVNDAYYGCFATLAALAGNSSAAAGDAGTVVQPDGGPLDQAALAATLGPCLVTGNLSPCLPTGPNYQLTLPPNAVAGHAAVAGGSVPYGLAIAFNIACAGNVKLALDTFDPTQPQSFPLQCVDDAGNVLTPDDYVFGYTRVYAYETDTSITNANPVITDVKVGGQIIDPHVGFTVQHGAPKIDVDVDVPDDVWEITQDKTADGTAIHEQVFASYYITLGKIDDEVRILFDPSAGKIDDHKTQFEPPADPGEGFMWIIVHDNRDGVTWVQVPIHVQ